MLFQGLRGMSKIHKRGRIMPFHVAPATGDHAVRSRTGKSWNQWFSIIDRGGGKKKSHKEVVAHLKKYRLGGWWEQMVAITYEQARGLRKKHEQPSGFAIGASRVMPVGVSAVYDAWRDEKQRRRWFVAAPLTIRTATKNKSLRITWVDRRTSVTIDFYRKGRNKSQVTVRHEKLPTPAAAERMKAYWGNALDNLKAFLG